MSHDPQHGTQVSCSRADGKIFLWYPANPRIWAGEWMACEERFHWQGRLNSAGNPGPPLAQVPRIDGTVFVAYGQHCYRYGGPTAPWTRQPAAISKRHNVESREGDIFMLAGRTSPPFSLAKARTTLDALLSAMPR